jgi:hypothetical protein
MAKTPSPFVGLLPIQTAAPGFSWIRGHSGTTAMSAASVAMSESFRANGPEQQFQVTSRTGFSQGFGERHQPPSDTS